MARDRRFYKYQEIKDNLNRKRNNKLQRFLLVIALSLSLFLIINNNPKLLKSIKNEPVNNFISWLQVDANSLKLLTEEFVIDIDEPLIIGDPSSLNKGNFAQIDQQALAINYDGDSVGELADILARYAHTDLEKARLIYSWITNNIVYDVPALFTLLNQEIYPDVSTEAVLTTRKTICSGYANLYQKLAQSMELKSVIVLGYAKGIDYAVGEDNNVNHAWNAVKIEGKWYLIDTTWGAGTVNNFIFKAKFNPYYFTTNPDEFIFSHFPEKEKWQLLARPYSRQVFDALPSVSATLFQHDIELVSHQNKTIYTNDRINIILKVPDEIAAIAKLKFDGNLAGDKYLEDNYIFVQNKNGYIDVNVAFPEKGNYKLDIFAKPKDNSNHYPHAVSYQIVAQDASQQFPKIYSHFAENNGYLQTPLTKHLPPNQLTYFKLRVENATEVKLLDRNSNNWTDLIKYGDLFSGNVRASSGKLIVFAKFPGDSRYWALLEYN